MAHVILSTWEYNVLSNEAAAFERALVCLLDERNVDELEIGNVYVYRAEGGGVGAWFIDEQGYKLEPVNYAMADKGVIT